MLFDLDGLFVRHHDVVALLKFLLDDLPRTLLFNVLV